MTTTLATASLPEQREDPLLRVRDLVVDFKTNAGTVHAVAGVSFDLPDGTTLGAVGESGCGKTTTGRSLLLLSPLTSGEVTFMGESLGTASSRRMRELRRNMQMVFQDPVSSLNPRRKVRELVIEGLRIAGASGDECVSTAEKVLEQVGLPISRYGDLLPRTLSGGQAQRVAIARAIAVRPKLLICDEPVSALDVSMQAQILNLIADLKEEYSLTVMFIAHDLAVVKSVSDRVMVMYLGRIVEMGDSERIYSAPAHHYTRGLLDSVPRADSKFAFEGPALKGDIPSPLAPPSGCAFRTRCPMAQDLCAQERPELREVAPGQFAACHFPLEQE